ncbi:hypothetical protein OSTOST_03881 [Ostertagia ostertagi]
MIHLDIDAARKRFKDRTLNTRNIDFSDSIAKRRGKSYGSSMYVLEVVGKDYSEPETTEQKFNRIACEIDELAQQLQVSHVLNSVLFYALKILHVQEDSAKTTPMVNESSLAALAEELKGVKVSKVSGGAPVSKEKETPAKSDKSADGKVHTMLTFFNLLYIGHF